MKSVLIAALFLASTAALAGGQTKLLGAPDDTWQGTSNKDDTQRTLVVTCPEDTAPARVPWSRTRRARSSSLSAITQNQNKPCCTPGPRVRPECIASTLVSEPRTRQLGSVF